MGETTLHVAIMSVCVVLINGPFLLCQCGANLDCAALFEVPPPPHTHTTATPTEKMDFISPR